MVLALGAGGVYAVKRGRGAIRRPVGWTAERAGFISGRVQETLAETRRLARERYEEGRAAYKGRGEMAPTSSRSADAAPSVNGTGSSHGHHQARQARQARQVNGQADGHDDEALPT